MTREPIVSGQFYESSAEELESQIKNCFLSKFGPGSLPKNRNNNKILGVISPHAGFQFSGPCTAFSFKAIAESAFPDVFIIFGVDHSGLGSGMSLEDWKTPFGTIKTDKDLIQELIEKTSLNINEMAHRNEHSIEVQLPFLQFACRDMRDKIRIIPITISRDIDIKKTADKIKSALSETNKKICFIASSDFTHYGVNYGFLPFKDDAKNKMEGLDKGAISFISALDPDGFLEYVKKTGATICGALPIALLLNIIKDMAKNIKLEKYYTSGDIIGDYSSAVGYASIIFE